MALAVATSNYLQLSVSDWLVMEDGQPLGHGPSHMLPLMGSRIRDHLGRCPEFRESVNTSAGHHLALRHNVMRGFSLAACQGKC